MLWARLFIDYSEMDKPDLTKKKILLLGLIYMWIHFIILIFFVSTNQMHKIILSLAWAVNMLNVYLLCRKKGVFIAARLLTIAWILNVTNTAWNTGGIYSTAMLWQIMIIFILAAYLDRKAALWVTLYVICTYIFFFYVQFNEIVNFKTLILKNPPYYELISVGSLFVVILFSLYFVFTDENFNRAWKKEKEVKIDTLQVELDKKLAEIGVLKNNIARDFHDEMGNKLASIRLLSENLAIKSEKEILDNNDLLESLLIIEKNAKELFEGTKDFIWTISNHSENIKDFFEYVRSFSEDFLTQFDIDLTIKHQFDLSQTLDSTISRQFIFIIKEIMTNVVKHAAATTVEMGFLAFENSLQLTVSDNGKGFDTSKQKSRGLKNIAYRANKVSSTFTCISTQAGTTYTFLLPLANKPPILGS